jgi:hypothetical protein
MPTRRKFRPVSRRRGCHQRDFIPVAVALVIAAGRVTSRGSQCEAGGTLPRRVASYRRVAEPCDRSCACVGTRGRHRRRALTRGRVIGLTVGVALAASLLSLGAWVLILVADLSSGCSQADDPTCSPMTGWGDVGYGLVLGAIGVVILGVIVAVGWGRPSPAFRWHALLALVMAPLPTVALLVFLLLYLPAGGVIAALASIGAAIVWLLGWAWLVRWASSRVPVAS